MDKIITLDERFPTGEQTVMVVGRWGNNSRFYLEKTASEDTYEFLKTVKPKPGFHIVLVNALGDFEHYDDNKNGDGFPNQPYKVGVQATCGHAECQKPSAWITEDETLKHHYKTFEEHGGIYRHHQNKDKSKSLGNITHAFLNPKMCRVELLLEINKDKDKELSDRLDAHEYLAVSMGCHVKWDVCTICGHRAPTRAQYCSHTRNGMRTIDPKTGKKAAVLNPSPKFFDISFVIRPADPTGYMLKKVATAYELHSSSELGEKLANNQAKIADVKKLSDIKKLIEGQTTAIAKDDKELQLIKDYINKGLVRVKPPLETKTVQKLSSYPMGVVLTSLPNLSNTDIGRIFFYKTSQIMPNLEELQKVSELTPIIFELAAKYAEIEDSVSDLLHTGLGNIRTQLPIVGEHYKNIEPPKSDLLTLTDPFTGHQYQTTRGAAIAADKMDAKNKVIGSGLLAAGYYALLNKLLSKAPGWTKLPVALAAGTKTYDVLRNDVFPQYRNQKYLTDQGIPISGGTGFTKMNEYLDKIATDNYEFSLLCKSPTINRSHILKTAELHEKASLTEIGLVSLSPEKALNILLQAL